jgi:hypothetical protein
MIEKEKTKSRIPRFANRQEEAEFWDTHDFGDYWDETAAVDVEFSKNLSENLTVRLSPGVLKQLRQQAEQVGVGPSTLARMWILEHLRATGKRRPRKRV